MRALTKTKHDENPKSSCVACLAYVSFSCDVSCLSTFFTSWVSKYLYTIPVHPVNVDRLFSFRGTHSIIPFRRKCEKICFPKVFFVLQTSSKSHSNHDDPIRKVPVFQFAPPIPPYPPRNRIPPFLQIFVHPRPVLRQQPDQCVSSAVEKSHILY